MPRSSCGEIGGTPQRTLAVRVEVGQGGATCTSDTAPFASIRTIVLITTGDHMSRDEPPTRKSRGSPHQTVSLKVHDTGELTSEKKPKKKHEMLPAAMRPADVSSSRAKVPALPQSLRRNWCCSLASSQTSEYRPVVGVVEDATHTQMKGVQIRGQHVRQGAQHDSISMGGRRSFFCYRTAHH